MARTFKCSDCQVIYDHHVKAAISLICPGCHDPIKCYSNLTHVQVECPCNKLENACINLAVRFWAGLPPNWNIANSNPAKTESETIKKNIKCPICFKNSEVIKMDDREIQLACCYINAARSPSAYKEANKRYLK